MASAYVVLLLLMIFEVNYGSQQQQSQMMISPGSSLFAANKHNSWQSPSGRFAFGFYPHGNGFSVGIWLVTSPDITIIWTANRDEPPVSSIATLAFTMDGKLVLRADNSKDGVIANTLESASFASMLDSGNFVLYNKSSDIIWSSFNFPTDTILGDQNLYTGHQLFSSVSETNHSTGRFRLKMQEDGNLVLYPTNTIDESTEAYWASNTELYGEQIHLYLNSTGELLLLNNTNEIFREYRGSSFSEDDETAQIIANSSYSVKNQTVIYRATFDPDGILRMYSHHFNIDGSSNVTMEWSALQNQCQVNGFCGVNSFCSSSGSKVDCHCFPGFVFINPNMQFQGCYKSFKDEQGCKRKEPAEFYTISALENMKLGGLPYAMLSGHKEDCSKSCLDDCYCGAASYLNGTCKKFRLPLIFGMKDQNESATVFIRWSSGNPNLTISLSSPPIPNLSRVVAESKKKLITILASSLGFITFLFFLLAISSFVVYKLRVNRYRKLPVNLNLGLTQEFTLQSFSYNDLQRATDGFKEELGKGRFGAVYKGTVPVSEGNKIIAVKRLEKCVEEGERKFRAEMAAVRRTHHRNLVRLLGFCMERSSKLLVYEYMSKGSLAEILFNVERRPIWKERVRIALDVARGILYLHEECEVQIIHCDIKPRNILVDDSWTAKISDFGLAMILMPSQTGTFTGGVRGSRGYIAPEWQNNAPLTVKSDVYSFGVVLLEIVCCRSNLEVNVATADEVLLINWVHSCFVAGKLDELVVEEEVDMKTLERMVKVGLLCVQHDPSLRPCMKNVILMLEGIMGVPVLPFSTPPVVT